jgi:hypothetical protein
MGVVKKCIDSVVDMEKATAADSTKWAGC